MTGKIKLSLHNHTTRYSDCSSLEPWELMAYAVRAKYDGVAITEHCYQWTENELKELKELAIRKGYCSEDFLLFSGQEVYCSNGHEGYHHALVFGFRENITYEPRLEDLCSLVHSEGGIVILAHPLKHKDRIDNFWEYDADGVEVLHSYQNSAEVLELLEAHEKEFAQIGSDDAHDITHIGFYCTLFPGWVKSKEDLVHAIRINIVKPYKM
ncbi:hypothetical protein ACFL6I_09520 [candidate division KSB1 bacterium]